MEEFSNQWEIYLGWVAHNSLSWILNSKNTAHTYFVMQSAWSSLYFLLLLIRVLLISIYKCARQCQKELAIPPFVVDGTLTDRINTSNAYPAAFPDFSLLHFVKYVWGLISELIIIWVIWWAFQSTTQLAQKLSWIQPRPKVASFSSPLW
jgi:hypothetical protein